MTKRIITLLVLVLAASTPAMGACTSTIQTGDVFLRLNQSVDRMKPEGWSSSDQARLKLLRESVDKISDVWARKGQPNLSADYVQTLCIDLEVIASARPSDDSARAALTKAAFDDLAVKAKHASGPFGASASYLTEATVTVRTRKGSQDVNGYLVHCNPKASPAEKPARFPYNNETSPSERSLPIGNFVMWIEKDGKVVSTRDITVEKDAVIFFEVP